ncbi:Rne/Rng family ribonuclease [Aquamicrobium terrae]|uniref:Ribonuclease E n=1 Tax=Aquamicrobium terrae TaxID=1324945 RepID=A0ABV2MTS4_9HYPH
MPNNKMLIDASHPEETRVVVVRGNRIEEFDFESQDKKQLKGNIYLARVTRVEPSLQAAFVEYGGNRHGFLAFSEIHPDYYQIPVADRQALLAAEAEDAQADHDEDHGGEERKERDRSRRNRRRGSKARDHGEETNRVEAASNENADETEADDTAGTEEEASVSVELTDLADQAEEDAQGEAEAGEAQEAADEAESGEETEASGDKPSSIAAAIETDVISEPVAEQGAAPEAEHENGDRGTVEEVVSSNGDDHEVESVGAEDALEEARNRRKPPRRQYKIQEVIKRRQILLVQVVKEERGNKGAALTTYLSLAGRYSVLMPNTARGGGISRKITNAQDRKRLKEIMTDLEVPEGMGVILRTAGESRTKAEIKRDYEYLMRMWENVRNLTLQSTAPALVYEEGSLIKRSVRDLYNKDINEVLVAGEEGYREAKDFMRMLMPSHAKVVQPYRDTTPIFVRSGIEGQLDRMVQPQVTLKSGGYLIINQTEALVSIDVNSGRSTKEHSIEETALHTNLEAAEEIARQLRLRDLAGLIVIDFIDMEESRNNRAVEKRLKEHLKNDRARIQVGRISHFGLLEMSRQRIRASVLESTMKPCPHCGGTGHVRSDSSVALMVVRAIEEFLLKDSRHHITVRTPATTALYVLNHKRSTLIELEKRFGVLVTVEADESTASQHYVISRGAIAEKPEGFVEIRPQTGFADDDELDDEIIVEEEDVEEAVVAQGDEAQGESQRDRKRRRRRRRRGGRDREHGEQTHEAGADSLSEDADETGSDDDEEDATSESEAAKADDAQSKKRRRGKRGGRRSRNGEDAQADGETAEAVEAVAVTEEVVADTQPEVAEAPAPEAPAEAEAVAEAEEAPAPAEEAPAEKPKRARRTTRAKKAKAEEAPAEAADAPAPAEPAAKAEAAADAPLPNGAADAEPAEAPAKPTRSRRKVAAAEVPAEPVVSSVVANEDAAPAEEKPKRGGWWQRKSFF